MAEQNASRRARLAAETGREIKAVALTLLATGGPEAVSLRAIAREMGTTAGAVYGYYPSRDNLVASLIGDVGTALVDAAEAAAAEAPGADAAARVLAWAHAFRDWSLAHPEGFRLLHGDAAGGHRVPGYGPAAEAGARACAGLATLIAAARPAGEDPPGADAPAWPDFEPAFAARIRARCPELPPDAVALALRARGRMHGLVALEIHGHLRSVTRDPGKLYRAEMADLVRSLGLTVAA
ncbi:TetR/AcrR family transcriptional regulator [Streptomyces sp. NPDC046215]|uniref:TetR/AcrR family transcriptional regulator n=1 Tax=Streptomyces stramineus TaxID=173861 RepID=A0ABP3JWY5_9ACTN